jgi:hypothetical protein
VLEDGNLTCFAVIEIPPFILQSLNLLFVAIHPRPKEGVFCGGLIKKKGWLSHQEIEKPAQIFNDREPPAKVVSYA